LQVSLAVQTRWLDERLEYHLLGNHLFANAKALLYAGLYFDGAEAERWYARGMRILTRELPAQVLPDGGHFELSPMYHAAVLEDLLDLVNLLATYGREPPRDWLSAIARMRAWLMAMSHPDGGIAFFNDAAFGMTPTFAELEAYALRLGLPSTPNNTSNIVRFDASGYVRAGTPAAYLVCDCAAVGADYQPGHAHADALSFELSLGEQRVLVNSGTSQYGSDAERQRQRGTAAHNTLVLDGQDSSEVWAGFRVARRARVTLHAVIETQEAVIIEASHDGYRRLPGRNEHRRRWILAERSLRIEDEISGTFKTAQAHFHLHPEIEARVHGAKQVLFTCDGRSWCMAFEGATTLEVRPGTWHPRFGVAVPNCCIVASFEGTTLTTSLSWELA
jgi:uncharacterized heparinase superfamily protein